MRRRGERRLLGVQLLALVTKELHQTVRDRRMMFLLVAAPLIQLVLFGYAVNLKVEHIETVIVDQDDTVTSRGEVEKILADRTLVETARAPSAHDAEELLVRGEAQAAVVLPERFSRSLAQGESAVVQAIVDGSDPNRSLAAGADVTRYFGAESARILQERVRAEGLARGVSASVPSLSLDPRLLYNPQLDTAVYIVPGVAAILLMLITTIVTAMGLSRERETGTLEQVLVTPIRPLVVVLGKILPFAGFGLLNFLFALVVGAWLFEIPLRGSLLAATGVTVLYLIANLGTGVFISTVSKTQQQALLAGFLFLLPASLLSGVMTPVLAMPPWLQLATWVNPMRHYAELLRALLLQGARVLPLWPHVVALALYGAVSVTLAVRGFRKTVS